MNHRIRHLALAALLPLALAQVSVAQAPTPGERWRTTTSMEGMGMKMPGMTTEVCSPKNADNSPPMGNEDCQTTSTRRRGNTTIMEMLCKDGTTGTMEMTQESPTRWSGRMTSNGKDGEMTVVMKSEKLPGECDASAMQRKVNKMLADNAAQQAKMCLENGRNGSFQMFVGAAASCKDKASVDAYCANARTLKGFNALSRQQRMGQRLYKGGEAGGYLTILPNTGKLCGFAPETIRNQYCSTAQAKKEWTFLAEECDAIAKPLAQRECAGRDFTNPVAPAWVDFCSAYASADSDLGAAPRNMDGKGGKGGDDSSGEGSGASGTANSGAGNSTQGANGEQPTDKPKATDKAKEAIEKSKNALRGLFGR